MFPQKYKDFGLATVTGQATLGFFVPYRHAASVVPPTSPVDWIQEYFHSSAPAFLNVLDSIGSHAKDLSRIGPDTPPEPRWNQDWFSGLDAAAAYAIVRDQRPHRIVEIGSGHSTRFMARAIRDGGLTTAFHAIDPAPRASLSTLGITHHSRLFQDAADPVIASLGPGDVLFIDSSHVAMPGTDVDLLFTRVIPGLPKGVIIHVHDVFLPDPYPENWAWRGYGEHMLVAASLAYGGLRPLFASHWVRTRLREAVASGVVGSLPLPDVLHESSLWLVKDAHPVAGQATENG